MGWDKAVDDAELVDMTTPFQVLAGVRTLFEIGRNRFRFGFSPVAADLVLGPGADEFVDAMMCSFFGGFRHDGNNWLFDGIRDARRTEGSRKTQVYVFQGKWEGCMAIFGSNSVICCRVDEGQDLAPLLF